MGATEKPPGVSTGHLFSGGTLLQGFIGVKKGAIMLECWNSAILSARGGVIFCTRRELGWGHNDP